jgi:hypothetical protein
MYGTKPTYDNPPLSPRHGWHGEQIHNSFTYPGNKIGIVVAGDTRCSLCFSYIWSCVSAYTTSQTTPHVRQDAWWAQARTMIIQPCQGPLQARKQQVFPSPTRNNTSTSCCCPLLMPHHMTCCYPCPWWAVQAVSCGMGALWQRARSRHTVLWQDHIDLKLTCACVSPTCVTCLMEPWVNLT